MRTDETPIFGWNGRQYVAGDLPADFLELLRHIRDFWSDGARGWAPGEVAESLQNIDFQRMVQLGEEIPRWYSGQRSSEGQLLLAWVALGGLAEGGLQWFLSVYKHNYLADPLFRCRESGTPIPPEDIFFAKLIAYFKKRIWIDGGAVPDGQPSVSQKSQMTALLHTIRTRRNAIHGHKTDVGTWDDWRECVREFVWLLCELEGRIPYPDAEFSYPIAISRIMGYYSRELGHCAAAKGPIS